MYSGTWMPYKHLLPEASVLKTFHQIRQWRTLGIKFFFWGGGVQKVPKLATKLAKHSVKQRKTKVIGGGGKCPLCPPL